MSSLAAEIQDESNCGADYKAQNPTVLQAYSGLKAYEPLYHAGCMMDEQSNDYCFVDAVTNASSPSSVYIYYLPLGISLPSTTVPSCSTCMQDTMAIFANAASDATQPVSGDYSAAAQLIDTTCGAKFVNASVIVTSAATSINMPGHASGLWLLPLIIALLASFL